MPSVLIENINTKSFRIADYRDPNGTGVITFNMELPKNAYRIKTVNNNIMLETIEGRRVFEFDEEFIVLLGWTYTDLLTNCNNINKIIFE